MYPNPQDVLPLLSHPDLHYYRQRADDLVEACSSGDPAAIRAWAMGWLRELTALLASRDRVRQLHNTERYADQLAGFARETFAASGCALEPAQRVVARAHGFGNWPDLVHHLEALGGTPTPISLFEAAADAIIAGDGATLDALLRERPELVHKRSTREHRATLLHYVAANGVENYRQVTPPNIVDIARRLLDAGAEVDADADVYGGGATTLGLTVTSAHPRLAGVQNELADLLLARGARIDAGIVLSCLRNGCPEAAEHLARRGVPCGLVEAAGIGRGDLVERTFDGRRSLADAAWRQEVGDALMMATWYDRRDVVTFLLDRGFDPGWKVAGHGDSRTALHVAAYEGRDSIVALLLHHAAPVNATDDVHGTTPLVWALHAWLVEGRSEEESYRLILRMLVDAGATVKAEWIDDDRVRADPALYKTLMRRAAGR